MIRHRGAANSEARVNHKASADRLRTDEEAQRTVRHGRQSMIDVLNAAASVITLGGGAYAAWKLVRRIRISIDPE